MASVITIAGENLFAAKAQANEQLDIDTFIFANVPAQDPAALINRDEGLPTDHVVHQQIVQQVGRINTNVVVYSTVLDSVTGPFEFNWVGLYSSVNQTLVAINHIPSTAKTITESGAAGNTLNRNFGIEYSGIADLTGIDVSPETWQLDFTARLSGMDKLTQQLATDMNGKDWFIEDGFKVFPRATANTFSVTPGVGYVSGLRVGLEQEHILTLSNYPQFIYVDAWFTGTSSSQWKPNAVFTVTNTEMDDYIDPTGVQHYVYRLALVNAADDVDDLREVMQVLKSKDADKVYARNFNSITDLKLGIDSNSKKVDMKSKVGDRVAWLGRFAPSDGGSNWGVIKYGPHIEDGGRIFSIDENTYVEANITKTTATNCKKFGLIGDGVSDDTLQAQRWRNMGGKLRAMRGERYLIKGEMVIPDNCEVDLNGSTWDFQTIGNVHNFTLGVKSKLTNGTIYANNNPNNVSSVNGCRPVQVLGLSEDPVNSPRHVWGWEISKLKIFGGRGFGNGVNRGVQPILMRGDVSEGVIKQISIDGRGLTSWGIYAEWWGTSSFPNPSIPIRCPRNIKISGIKFKNPHPTEDGFVVGHSGCYNIKVTRVDIEDCASAIISSMGEAGPSYCDPNDAEKICTGNIFSQVKARFVREYGAQLFGKANPIHPMVDNLPRGDVTFDNVQLIGDLKGGGNYDGIFASGIARVNIINNSEIKRFTRHGVYPFNGTVEMNVDKSTVSENGLLGVYYIGNASDSQLVQGAVTHSYIHSNGKLGTIDNDKVGVGLFYCENVKVLFNRFGSGQGSDEGATQKFCVRGLSSVSPKKIQIIGNYKDAADTGISHTWFTARENNALNNETYKILITNNMLDGTLIDGTYTRTTDDYL
ncbi:phage tail protein [Pseudoalteromonas distincta]|uniref:phage tail-collar fiber domain-containing protein n=1 Tax=Pseudoalteromonas distincta TaxID=77608 RepID=UPI0039E74475